MRMPNLQEFLKQYLLDHPGDVETLVLNALDPDTTWEIRTREHLHKIFTSVPDIGIIEEMAKLTKVPVEVLIALRHHPETVVVTPALVDALGELEELRADDLTVLTYLNPVPRTWTPEQQALLDQTKVKLGLPDDSLAHRVKMSEEDVMDFLVWTIFGTVMDAVGEVHVEDTDMLVYYADGLPADDKGCECGCEGGDCEGHDQLLEKAHTHLGTHGYTMIAVHGAGDHPGFVYSIGIPNTANAPECIVIGLPAKVAASVIQDYYDRVKANGPLEVGKRYSEFIKGFDMQVELVDKSRYEDYLGLGMDFHDGDGFACVQLVAPSTQGVWPWEPGADETYYRAQPRLSLPQEFLPEENPDTVIAP